MSRSAAPIARTSSWRRVRFLGERAPVVSVVTVGPRYFDAVGLSLRRGRAFTSADGAPGGEVAVVNERFAARFFPNEDPLGRRIRLHEDGQRESPWIAIVGVSPTVRQRGLQDLEPDPVVHVPLRQDTPRFASLIVRTRGEPGSFTTTARQEVRTLDPDLPVNNVQTMNQYLAQSRWPFRVFGTMFAVFAAIALILSAAGIYAVMAYAVTQRTQEIGVRVALGAQGAQVSWLIVRQGLLQLAIGLVLGLSCAFGVSRVLQSLLVQISPTDPATFTVVAFTLTGVTPAACLVPARRAMKLDPVIALRAE
jgi:putative ABC transport system permease protein